jgi:hypothetical protein
MKDQVKKRYCLEKILDRKDIEYKRYLDRKDIR